MNSKNRKYVLLATIPAVVTPLAIALGKRDESNFLLGLSSDFWAGTLIGVSIVVAVAAIALIVRSQQLAR